MQSYNYWSAPISGLMNITSATLSNATHQHENDLIFASFNQDTTSLAVGNSSGYKLYSLSSCDSLEPIYENDSEEVYIAERLFSSSLVAIVSRETPRRLRVCHFKKGTEICNYSYNSKILSVKMNRSRLVVCLEESLFVHNIRDMKVLHTIRDTPPNPSGLCALSTNSDNCFLAYPGHSSVGELQIFDAMNLSSKTMIPAHTSNLVAIAFSPSGTRVATASDKGTVIRVFNVNSGTKLYELRRGLKRTAHIYSLSFSPCGRFLACSSNTETVHIFRLEEQPRESEVISQSPPNDSWGSYFNNMVSASASYLPTQVTDTLLQGRAFATIRHNQSGLKNICALALIKKSLRLLITSQDGYLYMYGLNLEDGGEGTLIKQFQLSEFRPLPTSGTSPDGTSDDASMDEASPPKTNPPDDDVSYADRVKNRHPHEMTDSEKFHEMEKATASPPRECFLLDDDGEFPPMQDKRAARP
ncbi:hypothetical protein TCAL_09654 [Tigriopus californicus]|uniref:Uncharacterized protein n=1 Tax=Tigriopus californicus TaxID=6832 RepID=A0A553NUH5_TIGCA|nr:WD repeat domain phosphoinositide-interacting protein 2-like isoform X2 [Tigriopus californicus]TRY69087.1 hypothetical protein TCAL_09654 [Tigriopus californicus]|eukprot:TCALIF_09654-PA protein Name:"Similar to WIPI2 WD repeat domain phosphoinositide-interacting protein 2 (Gallus gallus)" AED:0.03 eAED:0.03 QI:484/1/1/1/0.85/0.87/8/325/470